MPDTLTATDLPAASTPERLAALCAQWRAEEREIWITLRGGSMTPNILPGTRFCLRCHRDMPKIGEIIAYRQENMLVVHRLIEITSPPEDRQMICLGDGNVVPDAPAPIEAFVGTVSAIASQPFPRRLLFALRHPRRHVRYWLRRLRIQAR